MLRRLKMNPKPNEVITERDANGKPIAGRYSFRKLTAKEADIVHENRVRAAYRMRCNGYSIADIAKYMFMPESIVRLLLKEATASIARAANITMNGNHCSTEQNDISKGEMNYGKEGKRNQDA